MLKYVKSVGLGMIYTGKGVLFSVGLFGSVVVDALMNLGLLVANSKPARFKYSLTGFLWQRLISSRDGAYMPSAYHQAAIMLLFSFLGNTIPILLLFALGAPQLGLALLIGFGVAGGILAIGVVLSGIADLLDTGSLRYYDFNLEKLDREPHENQDTISNNSPPHLSYRKDVSFHQIQMLMPSLGFEQASLIDSLGEKCSDSLPPMQPQHDWQRGIPAINEGERVSNSLNTIFHINVDSQFDLDCQQMSRAEIQSQEGFNVMTPPTY